MIEALKGRFTCLCCEGRASEFGYKTFDAASTARLTIITLLILDNEYAQNFAVSHNAGVVLAWLLPALVA